MKDGTSAPYSLPGKHRGHIITGNDKLPEFMSEVIYIRYVMQRLGVSASSLSLSKLVLWTKKF